MPKPLSPVISFQSGATNEYHIQVGEDKDGIYAILIGFPDKIRVPSVPISRMMRYAVDKDPDLKKRMETDYMELQWTAVCCEVIGYAQRVKDEYRKAMQNI